VNIIFKNNYTLICTVCID